MMAPVIICGMHGGGTSYATKLLRWCGFWAGSDAGDRRNRKWHESRAMVNQNDRLIIRVVGEKLRMRNMAQGYHKVARVIKSHRGSLAKYYSRKQADAAVDTCLSGYRSGPWGWKDPRNSVTLSMWLDVFPKARVLCVHRRWRPGLGWTTRSGEWFAKSSLTMRCLHEYPLALSYYKGCDVYHAEFEKIVTDWEYFNNVLDWIGLGMLRRSSYENLLKKTRYEGRSHGA